ncbi:hypothetical protein MTBBW1_1730009 [Desulfamplus magnetovallimortis]|uniref:Uncharacterized protein n=1 Tax=Desulfamplus magnetovallimortis TaxID=1246637 RepID=A0A1W1H9R4_9BACT|nr:hypothetical protein MTBBW1_1730009 [Desulfamplus magnetovallimortis]
MYMTDDRHNRKDESRFKNRMLPRLSYNGHGKHICHNEA